MPTNEGRLPAELLPYFLKFPSIPIGTWRVDPRYPLCEIRISEVCMCDRIYMPAGQGSLPLPPFLEDPVSLEVLVRRKDIPPPSFLYVSRDSPRLTSATGMFQRRVTCPSLRRDFTTAAAKVRSLSACYHAGARLGGFTLRILPQQNAWVSSRALKMPRRRLDADADADRTLHVSLGRRGRARERLAADLVLFTDKSYR